MKNNNKKPRLPIKQDFSFINKDLHGKEWLSP